MRAQRGAGRAGCGVGGMGGPGYGSVFGPVYGLVMVVPPVVTREGTTVDPGGSGWRRSDYFVMVM
ncbi:hypothetical protein GCM10010255_26440 [Streptomyces coeruleofuscus]|uniref:Uncharacterized protein n=1 Tax=Streptomyces coeruleofuscus TaxID=66879 RepID=A0ABN3I5A0_9ACTN